jgi:hypothetical protein
MPTTNITALIETFARQIADAVQASAVHRAQAALANAFGAPQKRKPGRPPKQAVAAVAPVAGVAGKKSAGKTKRPKQLCPVPGCKNVAAPIFGMVCKDHKGVAKSKIKKYRELRKAAPASAARPAAKKAKKASPKVARARKLQGQYMGALRGLAQADRAKVKAVAKDKGVAAAVEMAKGMKKGK